MEPKKKREIKYKYQHSDDLSREMYIFAYRVLKRMNKPKDYGTGEPIPTMDVHVLTLIVDHPGITVVDTAKIWERTPGRMSQVIGALAKRGLVERRKEDGNEKNVHLYATEKGMALSDAHKAYDKLMSLRGKEYAEGKYTKEEGDAFYKVMRILNEYYKSEE